MAIPQAPIGSGFGAASTIAEVIAGRDLTGKTILVSGGYSGIGVETVRAFCSGGARVVVPARTRVRISILCQSSRTFPAQLPASACASHRRRRLRRRA